MTYANKKIMPKFTRLPKHITPLEYHLEVYPNLNDFKNYGNQKILIQIDQSKLQDDENIIRIHASEIKIEKCDFNSVVPEKIDYDEENQEIGRAHV